MKNRKIKGRWRPEIEVKPLLMRLGSFAVAVAIALSPAVIPSASGAAADTDEQSVTEYVSETPSALPDSAELERMYIEKLFYGDFSLYSSNYGRDQLTDDQIHIYDTLRDKIKAVANGSDTDTTIVLTRTFHSSATTDDEFKAEAAVETNKISNDVSAAFQYLLVDLPEYFYWFDKTEGLQKTMQASSSGTNATLTCTVEFYVSEDYKGSSDTTVDPAKITVAKAAVANAQTIAARYADKTAYEKIIGYCNEICKLTEYNHDAADDSKDTPYGDPWQLVWVFDDDASTNVVCEGYSKAFQYLCDLGGVECYTVTGTMAGGTGAGPHMWNVVVLDGKNYLVDVTNSDGGLETNGRLVLKGAESKSEGYVVDGVTFTYDKDALALYSSDILTVSAENYVPAAVESSVTVSVSPKTKDIAVGDEFDVTVKVTKTGELADVAGDITCDSNLIVSATKGAETANGTLYTVKGLAVGNATLTFRWTPSSGSGVTLAAPASDSCTVKVAAAECVHEVDPNIWKKDESGHWHECSKCDEEVNKAAHIPGPAATETTAQTCTICGYEIAPKLSHVHKWSTAWESNESGHWHKCTDADCTGTSPIMPHVDGEIVRENEVAATCTAQGSYVEVVLCMDCHAEIRRTSKVLQIIDHDYIETREKETPATCTKTGSYDQVKTCKNCKKVERKTIVVSAMGHDPNAEWTADELSHWHTCKNGCDNKILYALHAMDNGRVTIEPTKDTTGVRTFYCSVCSYSMKTETIPALGENHVHAYTRKGSDTTYHWAECECGEINYNTVARHNTATKDEIVSPATCVSDGSKYVVTYCKDCSREISRTNAVIAKTGKHTYDKGVCTVCGAKDPLYVAPHTHTAGTTWSANDTQHWHVCSVTGCNEQLDKAAHTSDTGKETIAATATTAGLTTYSCTVCGKVLRTEIIPATGGGLITDPSVNPSNPSTPTYSNVVKAAQSGENAPGASLRSTVDNIVKAAMTAEEQEQVRNGVSAQIVLTVDNAGSSVSAEDMAAVANAVQTLGNYTVGQYLDINLLKTVGSVQKKILETRSALIFTIEIPEALRGNSDYALIRVHNGEASVLKDMDIDPSTITVETRLFSTYAIVYREKAGGSTTNPTNPSNPANPTNPGSSANPETGVGVSPYIASGLTGLLVFALLNSIVSKTTLSEEKRTVRSKRGKKS